jgi:FkbM family methyltransferase
VKRKLVAAAAERLGRWPRLATTLLRLPRILPPRSRSWWYRSLSWPLAKRLRAETEVSVIGGSTILVRTDDSIGRALAISGVWEPNVTAAFRRCVSVGDVCLDIGAHVGYYTLLASKLVGPQGHVYAFEPSPANYRALRANLARNRVANVSAIEVAVGEKSGTAALFEGPGTNTGGATLSPVLAERYTGRRPQVMVDVRPVAAFVPERDFARIRLVKVDVEGYEVEVLRSLAPVFDAGARLAVLLEFTPGWTGDADATRYVETVCEAYRFKLYRLHTGYSPADLFPSRLDPPLEVDSVPDDQCDLLLTR